MSTHLQLGCVCSVSSKRVTSIKIQTCLKLLWPTIGVLTSLRLIIPNCKSICVKISSKHYERLLLHSLGASHEHGDKASQLKRQATTSRLIPQIRTISNNLTTDPIEINNTFKSFYAALYDSKCPTDTMKMFGFLQGLNNST